MTNVSGKNILVLGGAGFIGSHLVNDLLKSNASRVVAADSFFLGNASNLMFDGKTGGEKLEVVRVDATDFAALLSLVTSRKIDWIFNLAVVPLPTSIEFPSWTVSSNIQVVVNCCELMRIEVAQRMIHVSSSEVYGTASYVPMDESHPYNPSTPYAASKVSGDQIVQSYRETFNVDARIVRPFNNYGPKQNSASYAGVIPIAISRASQSLPIEIYGDGEQTRDYVYVGDTVASILRLAQLDRPWTGAVNIATGSEITINNLVVKILAIMNQSELPIIHRDARPGDVRRHSGDTALLEKLAGGKPDPLSDHRLTETVDWYLRREKL